MKNKYGVEIPKKCLTCHYKKDSEAENKVMCTLHYIYNKKSAFCDDYIMSSRFDNIGKSFGKVKSPSLIEVYTEAMKKDPSCNLEEIREKFNSVRFIF